MNNLPHFDSGIKRIDMKQIIKQELEELLLIGRDLTSSDFEKKLNSYLTGKSEEEKSLIREVLSKIQLSKLQEYKNLTEEISIIKQLDGIEEYINLSKISKRYFGKTKSWLFQRLHGYSVHGKPAKFTEYEKKELSKALLNLSEEIKSVAIKIA